MGTETEGAGPEQGTEGTGTEDEGEQTRSLDELLSALPEADRAIVLGEVRKGRTESKNLRDRLKEATPKAEKFDQLAAANQTETDAAKAGQTAAEARAAAMTAVAVKAEVKALAATAFADPEDAHAFLDLTDYVGDDGEIDSSRIQQDLKDLLAQKPHLARGDGKHAPRPDGSQGSSSRGTATATPAEDFAAFIRGQRN